MKNLFTTVSGYSNFLYIEKGRDNSRIFNKEDREKSEILTQRRIDVTDILNDIKKIIKNQHLYPYLLSKPSNHELENVNNLLITDHLDINQMILIGDKKIDEIEEIISEIIKNNPSGRFISIRYMNDSPEDAVISDKLKYPDVQVIKKGRREITFNKKNWFLTRCDYVQLIGYNPYDKHELSTYNVYR